MMDIRDRPQTTQKLLPQMASVPLRGRVLALIFLLPGTIETYLDNVMLTKATTLLSLHTR